MSETETIACSSVAPIVVDASKPALKPDDAGSSADPDAVIRNLDFGFDSESGELVMVDRFDGSSMCPPFSYSFRPPDEAYLSKHWGAFFAAQDDKGNKADRLKMSEALSKLAVDLVESHLVRLHIDVADAPDNWIAPVKLNDGTEAKRKIPAAVMAYIVTTLRAVGREPVNVAGTDARGAVSGAEKK